MKTRFSLIAVAISFAIAACNDTAVADKPVQPTDATVGTPAPAHVVSPPVETAASATTPLQVKIVPVEYTLKPCDQSPAGQKPICPALKLSRVESGNQWVDHFMDAEARTFGRAGPDAESKRVYRSYQEMVDAYVAESDKAVKEGAAAYELHLTPSYHGVHGNAHMFTLKSYTYWGGAHGMPITTHYLLDTTAKKQLLLPDLLEPGKEAAFNDLARHAYQEWIQRHHPTNAAEHEKFFPFELSKSITFTDKGVLLHYQPYDLDAFAAGEQSLTIPYSKLTGILKPVYLR